MARRWLITGCSTGLGRALVVKLAEAGEQVVATARRPESLSDLVARYENVVAVALDVRDPAQCTHAVQVAVERFGGVDVLVNNAGYGQFGAVEEYDAELAAQFETNVFGPWRLTREVLPLWRAQGSGHAVFVSSIAAMVPFPGLTAYTASKFALDGMAESFALEVAHLNVKVTILQPGGFATAYGTSAVEPSNKVAVYEAAQSESLQMMRVMETSPLCSPPSLFADVVLNLMTMADPPLRLPVGDDAGKYLTSALAARTRELDGVVAAGRHVGQL